MSYSSSEKLNQCQLLRMSLASIKASENNLEPADFPFLSLSSAFNTNVEEISEDCRSELEMESVRSVIMTDSVALKLFVYSYNMFVPKRGWNSDCIHVLLDDLGSFCLLSIRLLSFGLLSEFLCHFAYSVKMVKLSG